MEHILKDGFAALGLPLSDAALGRFRTYYECQRFVCIC